MEQKREECPHDCSKCAFCQNSVGWCWLMSQMYQITKDLEFKDAHVNRIWKCRWFMTKDIVKALADSSSLCEFMIYADLLGCSEDVKKFYWFDWFPNTDKYATYKMTDYMRMIAGKRGCDGNKRIAFPPMTINIEMLGENDKFIMPSMFSSDYRLVSKYISENSGFVDVKKEPLAKFMM